VDADPRRGALVLTHLGRVAVAREHVAHLVLRQADVEREPLERGAVGDQLALAEVGAHEALLHRILRAVRGSEVDEPVGVERIGATRDVEAEVQSVAGRRLRHPGLHGQRLVAARAVLLGEMGGTVDGALGGRGRIELEAAPRDRDLVAVLVALERGLEAALADVAPGTGDVRPDLDVHGSLQEVAQTTISKRSRAGHAALYRCDMNAEALA